MSVESVFCNLRGKFLAEPEWAPENEQALLEPYTYVTSTPGKDMRGQLIDAFNLWLNVPKNKLDAISSVVSMLHNASLLLDDIEDDAHLRRGVPVAHKIYGVPQTINTANYIYFVAFKHLAALEKPETHSIVIDEMLNLHRGQGLEILWRDSLQCPTEEEYMWMVNNKTGGLLRIGIKLMMASATTKLDENYVPLVNLIGIHFQIRDDLINLQSTVYADNKGFAEDLSEGKFSFPIIHSIQSDKGNRQILNVLSKRPSSPSLKQHAVSYMKTKTKSFEYTIKVLESLEEQIREEILRLGGNPKLEALMDKLRVTAQQVG